MNQKSIFLSFDNQMLTSSSSSEDAPPPLPPPLSLAASSSSAAHHLRRLLCTAADSISQSNFSTAQNILSILAVNSSPYGDSTERLVNLFTKAMSLKINNPTAENVATWNINETVFTSSVCKEQFLFRTKNQNTSSCDFDSCYYLWLNQLTPFIRFGHLTANQAILDATETINGNGVLHILDLDISQGLQWPPLMQALAERRSSSSSSSSNPNPTIRITGCGRDLTGLNQTGDRLTRFANSLGLHFQFHTLLIVEDDLAGLLLQIRLLALSAVQGETIAVNCVHFLHRFDGDMICHFLSAIRSLNPRILTMVEREMNLDHDDQNTFSEALDHYSAIFDSLEATLPPNSRERLTLEQKWFGKEILEILTTKKQRCKKFEVWEEMMKRFGFVNVPIGSFALSQAKLLLRLHYPSEGYSLQFLNDSLFLGWQNRLLFSVSSWK